MIIHIDSWLDELKKLRAEFEQACQQNDDFSIERSLYYSALVIRKFSETPFVKRDFLSPVVDGQFFAPAKDSADGLNWFDGKAHFDLSKGRPGITSLADLCSILIHSRFLDWRPGTGKVKCIFVAGGMRSGVEAFGFDPSKYIKLLKRVEAYKFKRLPLRSVRRAG